MILLHAACEKELRRTRGTEVAALFPVHSSIDSTFSLCPGWLLQPPLVLSILPAPALEANPPRPCPPAPVSKARALAALLCQRGSPSLCPRQLSTRLWRCLSLSVSKRPPKAEGRRKAKADKAKREEIQENQEVAPAANATPPHSERQSHH